MAPPVRNPQIRETCLRILRMCDKAELEVVLGQVIAQLTHEQRLKGVSGVLQETINATNHYTIKR